MSDTPNSSSRTRDKTVRDFNEELKRRGAEAGIAPLLIEVLGYAAMFGDMPFYLASLSRGLSASSEGTGFTLPSLAMGDFEDLEGMPRWDVEVCLGNGTDDTPQTAYVPLEQFVHFLSVAAVMYANELDKGFDPWPFIAGMHLHCNLPAQKQAIPDSVKEYLGLTLFD